MKKKLIPIAIVGILIVGLLCVKLNDDKDSITIGAILPLTGLVSADGEESLRGVKIALEEIENSISPTNRKIVVKVQDGKYTAKDTLNAYKALSGSRIDGLLLMGELPCEVLADAIQREKLPTMATILGSDKVLSKSKTYVRAWMPIRQIGVVMAAFSLEKLGAKTAATLYVDSEFGQESKSAFEKRFRTCGNIVAAEKFSVDDRDVRNVVQKIISHLPDVVYVTGFAQGYVSAMNQLRELGFNGSIVTDMGIAAPQVYKNVKRLGNIYFVSADFGPTAQNLEYQKYRDVYFLRYNEDPKLISAMHYFALKGLFDALCDFGHKIDNRQYFLGKGLLRSPFGSIRFDASGEIYLPIIVLKFDPATSAPIIVDSEIYKHIAD